MTTRTSELPPEAFACEVTTASDYGRIRLGSDEFLLSSETRQRFISRSGEEVESVVTFSDCREYKAESRVSFGATPAGSETKTSAPLLDLPAGLPVVIALTIGIDSATAAGGDRFAGKLARPVVDARNKILVPEGSAVAGRLTKVAVHMQPAEVAIVFHVDTVRIDGAEVPFHLTGRTTPKGGWMREILSSLTIGGGGGRIGGITTTVHPPAPEGELNALDFPGARKVLEAGFQTEWVTVKP
jgi:hypothetical protein